MLRPGPLWIVIVALGCSMPARADDPPCGSQSTQPGAATPGALLPLPPKAAKTPASLDNNIYISSDQADSAVEGGTGTLKGNVEIRQGDRDIHTDKADIDQRDGSVHSDGHIDYTDPLVKISGATGSYSAASGADFTQGQFSLRERAARGTFGELVLTPQGVLRLKSVTFTTCPLNDSSWQLKADSITLDTRDKLGTGRDVQIDFMGVPLMYLPWASFPLSSERKSGFLFPTIGNTSYSGLQLSLPYYWNIAPNFDFTFEPTVYTRSGMDLGGDLRFLTEQQRGELDWNYLPDDRQFGGSRSRVRLLDVVELPDEWRLTLNGQNVSDDLYFEDFSQGPEGASTAFLERSATLSYRDEHWRIDGEAQQYQTIDYTLPVDERPYARVPRLAVASDYTLGPNGLIHYGFDSEVVDFQRPAGAIENPTGWRADITPQISLDLSGAGFFFRPEVAWRATEYQLDNTLPGQPRSPSRTLPIGSVDTGLMFERESGSRGQHTLTLEPRVMYLRVPYRNQDDLPIFDTAIPDLNPVELFRTNRYVGADRVSDADQLSLGVTSRLLDAQDGRQFLAATVGQIYYFQPPRVTLPGEILSTENRSDLVAQLAVTAFQNWSTDAAVQWNPQTQSSVRTQVNLQYKPATDSVVNLAYRYDSTVVDLHQVEISGAWPIKRNWNVFVRDVYSIPDHEEFERFAGFEYRACCWRLRLGARRYISSHIPGAPQDTGVWLQLELAGLAGVGSASDAFLTEEIRGYLPPGAALPKNQAPLKGIW